MDDMPKRRWWRKKRWWAVAIVWTIFGYPLSLGPVHYAIVRGWVSGPAVKIVSAPIEWLLPRYELIEVQTPAGQPVRVASENRRVVFLYRYLDWWREVGREHDSPP